MGDADKDLTQFASVRHWVGESKGDPIQARLRRRQLAVLAAFCEHRQSDPDAIVAESTASRQVKNDHMRELRKWVPTYAEGDRARHEAEAAVRSFFIANGLRVLTKPFRDIYHRSTPS
jgi:hypothetical protein